MERSHESRPSKSTQIREWTGGVRKRTRSRECALQILYQMDASDAELKDALEDFWKDKTDLALNDPEKDVIESDKKDPEVHQYAEKVVKGVLDHLENIDPMIERYVENWSMTRMAYVDRNILRLASFEILYCEDIPVKEAIHEAVELAKRYGESDSSKFVNGILDRIAKTENPSKKS